MILKTQIGGATYSALPKTQKIKLRSQNSDYAGHNERIQGNKRSSGTLLPVSTGYAVLVEDDPNPKYTSTRKTYAPIAYGSITYTPSQVKMSIYVKEFLAMYLAFKEFGHNFWGTTKPVIIIT